MVSTARSLGVIVTVVLGMATASLDAQNWVVSGQVTDAVGDGVSGVDIDLFDDNGLEIIDLSNDITASDGTFAMTINVMLPNGLYDVAFSPPTGSAFFATSVQVFLAGSLNIGVTSLTPGVFIEGQVVDELGVGLEEVDLDVLDSNGDPVDVVGDTTDGDGLFSTLAPVGIFDLKIEATIGGPYVPLFFTDVNLSANLDVGVLTLRDGFPLTGTVQNSIGGAVVGADVDINDPVTGERVFTPGDNTDVTGQFSVLVPAGDWTVEVDPPLGAQLVTVVVNTTVPASPLGVDIGTVVLAAGVTVSGRTVDGGASPVSDVDLDFIISATGIEIPTAHDNADNDGLFSVVVPADTYDIVFRPPFASGFAPRTLTDIDASTSNPLGDVVLFSGFAITGTVTANASPVANVDISMVDSMTQAPVVVFGGDTDFLGAYAYRQIAGTYDITFTPPPASGLAPHTEFAVVVNGDTTLAVDLGIAPPTDFVRGDANVDGTVNLADAVAILEALFSGGVLLCPDAADANDDGSGDISDAVYVLGYLFSQGPEPSAPFPAAGPDPTVDALGC